MPHTLTLVIFVYLPSYLPSLTHMTLAYQRATGWASHKMFRLEWLVSHSPVCKSRIPRRAAPSHNSGHWLITHPLPLSSNSWFFLTLNRNGNVVDTVHGTPSSFLLLSRSQTQPYLARRCIPEIHQWVKTLDDLVSGRVVISGLNRQPVTPPH